MGVINKSTAEINTLLDKVEGMPEEGVVGKTPVLETGSTTTLDPGQNATSRVVANGTDSSGNPKYKINFGIPRGYDGSGTGGVADSVQWRNVLNKPTWVNSSTKPTYTASEVGALPASTTIPSRTSQLTNDSRYVASSSLKTINGQSIVGTGNIEISGTGSGIADAPSDGKIYGRKNGNWSTIEGNVGSINIYDILGRLSELSEVQGTCTDEDYNALKGYADNGVVTYINTDGASVSVEIFNNVSELIIYYKAIDFPYYSYIGFKIGSSKKVSPLTITTTDASIYGDGILGEKYTKASSYSAITKSDSISDAIGKLEAGLSGINSSNGVYYLPKDISLLDEESTDEEVLTAFGGSEKMDEFVTALNEGKNIYIGYVSSNIPVSVKFTSLGSTFLSLSFIDRVNMLTEYVTKIKDIRLTYSASNKKISSYSYTESHIYGYGLPYQFYNLSESSSSDVISTAIGGESGMKNLIRAINNCDRIYIKKGGDIPGRTDLNCNAAVESENGDMSLMFTGMGYGLWDVSLGLCLITYTKSSNTFSATIIPLPQ